VTYVRMLNRKSTVPLKTTFAYIIQAYDNLKNKASV